MQIAVVGTGAIGSVFAYFLSRAGHAVTVVARGARLEQLRRDGAVVRVSGERAEVRVAAALDAAAPYDLVLVTVLAPQVAAVLPDLRASAARAVMFMFNTFEALDPLRDAVGAGRFVFGFPGGVFSLLRDGRIDPRINPGTTVGDAAWAEVFSGAGIPTAVEPDMHGWLRSHAALVAPLMAMGTVAHGRGAGAARGARGAALGDEPYADAARPRGARPRRGAHADRHDGGRRAREDRRAGRHPAVRRRGTPPRGSPSPSSAATPTGAGG